jgi:tRNA A37 methylthiotransferase MiaB
MFTNNKSIFIERLAKECILSDNHFVRLYNFFVINNYKITDSIDEADIVILDLCWVFKAFLNETTKKVENYLALNKNIILIWCVSEVLKNKFSEKLMYVSSKDYSQIENYFDFKISYSKLDDYLPNKISLLDIYHWKIKEINQTLLDWKDLKNSFWLSINDNNTSFIEISTGCSLNCSYCNIRQVKWKTKSSSIDKIINTIKNERNIWKTHFYLLSDDCGSYGLDLWKTLPDLLDEIFAIDDKIKVSITNYYPWFFLKHYEKIKKYIYENRIVFILLPIQHTSGRILKTMNRPYNIEKLEELIKDMKSKSNIWLCNHIIFDWPTETLEEFADTFKFLNLYDATYYHRYSDVNNMYQNTQKNDNFKKKFILLKKLQNKYNIDIIVDN